MARHKTQDAGLVSQMRTRLAGVSSKAWRRLLAAEKRRRGVAPGRLVFVGIHNVADVWWCAERAVRKAREREARFFGAYLRDRIGYSLELGRVERLPHRMEDWLTVGEDLTLSDINRLLAARRKRLHDDGRAVVAEARDDVLFVDPALSEDKKEWCAEWARTMGWELASADEDPSVYREMLLLREGERYPTIRWQFAWEGYVLVGVPDGLTDELVYEFRVAHADQVARRFVKPVATAQADLLAQFFRRPTRRVQIHVTASGKTYTLSGLADRERASLTLRTFGEVDAGQPPSPPAAWKCEPGRCEYVATCQVRRPAKDQ